MVVGLGTVFEGSAEDVVHNLPTNSDIPYGVINDENAYMLVDGQELINAQARGLGFGVMTGTQDVSGMVENLSKTTKQIMANSAVKQIMYLDDKETTELAIEFSGEANVMVRDNYEREGDMGDFFAGRNARVERRHRLTSTAIKAQGLGQAFVMYQGKTHALQVYNHGINEDGNDPLTRYVDTWFPVRMAKIAVPRPEELTELMNISRRREYEDLMLMVRDDSRKMLQAMNTYFQSMLTIRRMANQRIVDKGLIESAYGARNLFQNEYSKDDLVGIIRRVADARLDSREDVASFFVSLLENNESPSYLEAQDLEVVQRQAQESNISTGANTFGDGFEFETDDFVIGDDEGDEGSAAGSPSANLKPEAEEVDLLSAYLGEEITGAGNAKAVTDEAESEKHGQQSQQPQQPQQPQHNSVLDSTEALTPIAEITKDHLALMPWFGSKARWQKQERQWFRRKCFCLVIAIKIAQ